MILKAMIGKGAFKRLMNFFVVTKASALEDELPTWFQSFMYTRKQFGMIFACDPVEYCVRKDGIYWLFERKVGCISFYESEIRIVLSCCGDKFWRTIYSDYVHSAVTEIVSENSIATAKIKNARTWFNINKFCNIATVLEDE